MLWPSSLAALGTLRNGSSPRNRTLRISPGRMRSSRNFVRTKVMGQTSPVMSMAWAASPGVGCLGMPDNRSKLEALCAERGLKMTDQRRVIARVLSESSDHPDVEALHKRATAADPNISIATVYRTVRLFEEAGILAKHDFGDGRARYEETPDEHHDHLIDIQSGRVVEFHNDEIEELQRRIAEKAGYRLVGHRLELYGVPIDGKTDREK
jgi:Fur family ferric uptake transcriptional regulator